LPANDSVAVHFWKSDLQSTALSWPGLRKRHARITTAPRALLSALFSAGERPLLRSEGQSFAGWENVFGN
jgi:hypothetical protein